MPEPVQGDPGNSQADLQMQLNKIKANVILSGPVFPEPVQGPITLGYGCHFGLGLFVAEEGA